MLSNRTDNDVLQAFASLRSDPRFLKVLEYLKNELVESNKKLMLAIDPVIIHKHQGVSLTLSELIERAQTAHLTLKL